MKKRNRKICILLALVVMLSAISFSGCGEGQETFSVGQWLMLVNQTFGMKGYQSSEPYFDNVPEGSAYFEAVQTAAEWGVIDRSAPIDVEEGLTWKTVLLSLVNVGDFLPKDATDEEKVDYAIEHFDSTIRTYWMKRSIGVDKAVFLLGIAHEQWAGATFDHVIEKLTYQEDVVDLIGGDIAAEDCVVSGDLVKLPVSSGVKLEEGQLYVLPAGAGHYAAQVYRADKVYQDDEYLYIENSPDEIALEEVAEELFVEESYMPDMEKAVVYDGNGNILSVGSELSALAPHAGGSGVYMARLNDGEVQGHAAKQLADTKKISVKIDGFEVSYEYATKGKFHFKASVASDNLLDSKTAKLQTEASAEINHLEVTNQIDWGLWKGLESASLKLNYETKLTGSIKSSYQFAKFTVAPYDNRNSGFLTNLKNSSFKSNSAKGAKTIKIASVDFCSIGVARVCLDINLTISANGSFSLSVTEAGTKGLEYRNGNLRVINDSTRNTETQLKGSVELLGGIGPALYVVGLKKKIIGLQLQVGIKGEAKITSHLADSEMHLIEEADFGEESPEAFMELTSVEITTDAATMETAAKAQGGIYKRTMSESVRLHVDICADLSAYFLLRIELAGESLAADMMGGIKSFEILGKKDARLLSVHVDNGDWVSAWANRKAGWNVDSAACTLKYVPFDKEEGAEEQAEGEAGAEQGAENADMGDGSWERNSIDIKGDMIVLDRIMLTASIGDQSRVVVVSIPEGYGAEDLSFTSSNKAVATIDASGAFTAKAEGSTVIAVSTVDGRHKAYCAIIVLSEEPDSFTPIDI